MATNLCINSVVLWNFRSVISVGFMALGLKHLPLKCRYAGKFLPYRKVSYPPYCIICSHYCQISRVSPHCYFTICIYLCHTPNILSCVGILLPLTRDVICYVALLTWNVTSRWLFVHFTWVEKWSLCRVRL